MTLDWLQLLGRSKVAATTMILFKHCDIRPGDNEVYYLPYFITQIGFFVFFPARILCLVYLIVFACNALFWIVLGDKPDQDSSIKASPLSCLLIGVLQLGFTMILLSPATLLYLWYWGYI